MGWADLIKVWIASGREMQLGPCGQWRDVIEAAKEPAIPLLKDFRDHPRETRYKTVIELGCCGGVAAAIYALVIFLCDGLLKSGGDTPVRQRQGSSGGQGGSPWSCR